MSLPDIVAETLAGIETGRPLTAREFLVLTAGSPPYIPEVDGDIDDEDDDGECCSDPYCPQRADGRADR